jgi:hypothetical protein
MKHIKTSLQGLLFGLVLGALFSFGEIRMLKKSYRTTPVMIFVFSITMLFFGASCSFFFKKVESDIDKEANEQRKLIDDYRIKNNLSMYSSDYSTVDDLLGTNKSTTIVTYENNRLEVITKWIDNRTNFENSLITFENNEEETISTINANIYINYGKFENHKNTLPKLHAQSQYDYFAKLKLEHINSPK